MLFEFLFALAVALIITGLIAGLMSPRRPWAWDGIVGLFLILLFATWAGGVWLTPFGPTLFEIAILPFVFVGLITALIITATTPMYPSDEIRLDTEAARARDDAAAGIAMTAMIWVLLLVLLSSIAVFYFI